MIKVEQLTKKYGAHTAVDNIAFHVKQGEVFGLLGTNGAGKTTTLEIIEGLSQPSSGVVEVMGSLPSRATRAEMGIMLQHGGLPQELTVKETARMWAGTCSHPRSWLEAIELVDLQHKLDTKVGSMSGGEQRRLDLACAIMNRPKIIILDEPTTGLDPESRHNTWRLLNRLKEQGTTMLLTTHYLEEAEALCDRIAIMHRGTIAVQGELNEVLQSQHSEISFRLPDGCAAQDLPELPGAKVIVTNGFVTVRTKRLNQDTAAVLNWAGDRPLPGFQATPASLDQLFQSIA